MKAGYYAVIFTSKRTDIEEEAYADMAQQMLDLAALQPGFLGVEHARDTVGITVSYWETLENIAQWKAQTDHLIAQQKGRARWYESYRIRICRVQREYAFHNSDPTHSDLK